jgi:hypothetical protein
VRRVLEIAPPKPLPGINPSIQVDNCDYQKIKYLIIIYNQISRFFKNKSNMHLKLLGLFRFFHETQQFFEVFEIPRTAASVVFIFSQIP